MKLSVVIPAYNEAKRLAVTLNKVSDYLYEQNYDYEIIVVNDGSQDGTADLVSDLLPYVPYLKLVDYQPNGGKGYAVKTGMLAAAGDLRLFMDADGSTSIDQVEKLLFYIQAGYDVAVSSRRIKGADVKIDQPWYRLFLGWAFRTIVQIIVPLGVRDSQNGFKLFTAHAAEAIFSRQTIFRWAFDVEILALARKLKFKIKEVPIVWVNDEQSRVTLKGMIRMLSEVLTVRWNLWTGKYTN